MYILNLRLSQLLFFILFQTILYSQDKNIYAGIEIGSKGIKVSIIDVNNIKKADFELKAYWTDNIGIAKGISIDGNLEIDDINNAVSVVVNDYKRILKEFDLPEENIYIVGSSGVAMAKNTQDLSSKIKAALGKEMEFISIDTEALLLVKGCIPMRFYAESMLFDIGGGNAKGGCLEPQKENGLFAFSSLKLNYGSITLTESIFKKMKDRNDIEDFNNVFFNFLPVIRKEINNMFVSSPKN